MIDFIFIMFISGLLASSIGMSGWMVFATIFFSTIIHIFICPSCRKEADRLIISRLKG